MQTIKQIYKIGHGPSSSHTMGPYTGSIIFKNKYSNATKYRATLYGSLALTGRGHLTDTALTNAFAPTTCEIVWQNDITLPYHPNALKLEAFDINENCIGSDTMYSIGGGDIIWEYEINQEHNDACKDIYPMTKLSEIQAWCIQHGKSYWEYVQDNEESDLWDYMNEVWKVMKDAVRRGLENEGVLPGKLELQRKAVSYYTKGLGYAPSLQNRALLFAYCLAVCEENASGGIIATAPTCGSAGVLPSVLYYTAKHHNFTDRRILRALAVAGLIGNITKTNATISGAAGGCQAEIGTACAMASAAINWLFGGSPTQIEYAAEMGIEHHLGMTCDPIGGYVQIPCIERCCFAAGQAMNCNVYAMLSDGRHKVSFDRAISVMKQTGNDLPSLYRETSQGGLAKEYDISQ